MARHVVITAPGEYDFAGDRVCLHVQCDGVRISNVVLVPHGDTATTSDGGA